MSASSGGWQGAPIRIAVVGSGPAGMYTAEALLKGQKQRCDVDVIERLPTPFGLVRSGVAPDHQKIKGVTKVLTKIAKMKGFRFLGNVEVGVDLAIQELRDNYHAVVLAVGCESDRSLGVPGEDALGSYPAVSFVGWYNGHPDHRDLKVPPETTRAAIVGVGDVATDLTRIALTDRDALARTDIAEHALEILRKSPVHEVLIFGRRGPEHMKLAIRELRAIDALDGVQVAVDAEEVAAAQARVESPSTATQKKLEYLAELAARPLAEGVRVARFMFLRSPKRLITEGERLVGVEVERNRMSSDSRPTGTGEFERFDVQWLFRAIGYRGVPLEGVPFDDAWGTIPNNDGRVCERRDGPPVPGLYVAGWIKRGPTGVIGTNRADAVVTVSKILADLDGGIIDVDAPKKGCEEILKERGVRVVGFDDWERIDRAELERGKRSGKVREKFVDVKAMLEALDEA